MSSPTIILQTPASDPPVASTGLYRDALKIKPTVEMPKVSDIGLPSFASPYEERGYKKKRLALAFRIFAKHGFEDGVSGHITLRDPVEKTSFWVNPFGKAWSNLTAEDLILVNQDGKVVDGGPIRLLNAAAYAIHHAIHTARPEISCVAHSHSIYGKAFSTLGRSLDITTQDSCAFYNDLALYVSNGVVLDSEEGNAIAQAVGSKKAAILQNHGLITCGTSVESTLFWYIALERCCHAQMLADAAASGRGDTTVSIGAEDAAYTYRTVGSEIAGWFSAKPMFEIAELEAAQQ